MRINHAESKSIYRLRPDLRVKTPNFSTLAERQDSRKVVLYAGRGELVDCAEYIVAIPAGSSDLLD